MAAKKQIPTSPIVRIKTLFKKLYQGLLSRIEKFPLLSFFIMLAVLIGVIALSSFLHTPKSDEEKKTQESKKVSTYRVGKAPRIRLQAQVEKSGVIQITSLMGGVVQNILKKEGVHVTKGETLIWLSTTYQGGNVYSMQRQIAEKQLDNVEDTYKKQKEILDKQRSQADQNDANNDELRAITAQSITDTENVINLNNDILSTLNGQLNQLNATNSGGLNNEAVLALKQQVNQVQSANLQLNSGLRSSQYQSSDSNPSAKLSDLQRQITLLQLDIQEKALKFNKEISGLQLQLARINEALMYPSAPFSGTIQRVYAKEGQAVSPGTALFTLSQDVEDDPIVAIVYAPREVAQSVSMLEESTLYFGGQTYSTYPSYVTQDAVQGTLYGIYYPLPDNYSKFVTDKGFIEAEIPVGYFDTSAAVPFIPIDSIYQTQKISYVFVIQNGKATVRELELGQVIGSFAQVERGLKNGDQIILNRTVVTNEPVTSVN